MYSVHQFGTMMADRARTDAYTEALRRSVGPDSVVLDIGTGTGVHAFLACQLGARRVFAVEPGDSIEVARRIAATNGLADRIEFIQALSTAVDLPEPADVIVSDLRGRTPVFEGHLPAIVDARKRLLAPGGVLIPQRDVLWAAVVEAPLDYDDIVGPWDHNPLSLDMAPARQLVVNSLHGTPSKLGRLLTEPMTWATLDYTSVDGPDVRGSLTATVANAGVGHGIGHWFDTTLVDGVRFSAAPEDPANIYGRIFFPWSHPVPVDVGDEVRVELRAELNAGSYVWTWKTSILHRDGSAPKVDFRQSTLFAWLLSPTWLRHRQEDHAPGLGEEGQIAALILDAMAGGEAMGKIAEQVVARFPSRYPTKQQALARVSRLADKYAS